MAVLYKDDLNILRSICISDDPRTITNIHLPFFDRNLKISDLLDTIDYWKKKADESI